MTRRVDDVSQDANRVPIRELQHNSRQVLDRVEAGESLEITRDGEPVARLVPIDPVERLVNKLTSAGIVDPDWLHEQAELRRWLAAEPPLPAQSRRRPLSEALRELRDEERS